MLWSVLFVYTEIELQGLGFPPIPSAEEPVLAFLSTVSFVEQTITPSWLQYYLRRWFGKALEGQEKINLINLKKPISSSTHYT